MKLVHREIPKRLLLVALAGFVIGVFWLVALRFLTYRTDNVHYHANFALYINGQQDKFSSPSFYEEVQACSGDHTNNPKSRVHMHEQKSQLVHVHASAVTWSQFFTNLGYVLGDNLLKTDKGVYVDGTDGNRLKFIINGQETGAVANRVIQSEDVLLINYGRDDQATLEKRYIAIPTDADEANQNYDPSTCSGSEKLTFWKRLQKAVGV